MKQIISIFVFYTDNAKAVEILLNNGVSLGVHDREKALHMAARLG